MKARVVGLVALTMVALTAAAAVPSLARPASVLPASDSRPVPIHLAGMLVNECLHGLVFPKYVSVAVEPDGDRMRFVLERTSGSEFDPTAFPIVDFTPEEEALREVLEACAEAHPVSLAEEVSEELPVDRAIYQDYLERRILPCLATHGVTVIDASELGPQVSSYGWYVASLYQLSTLEAAVDAWYDCPVLPPYLHGD